MCDELDAVIRKFKGVFPFVVLAGVPDSPDTYIAECVDCRDDLEGLKSVFEQWIRDQEILLEQKGK